MINVNITQTSVQFFSSVADWEIAAQLIAPNWELVDSQSLHISCEAGVYCFSTTSTTFNDQQFDNSEQALKYLKSL